MQPILKSDFVNDLHLTATRISQKELGYSPKACPELEQILKDAKAKSIAASKKGYEEYRAQWPKSPFFEEVSLFEPMGFENRETLFSRTLAWLLDSSKKHNLDSSLVKYLLELASNKRLSEKGKLIIGILSNYQVIPEWQVTPKCRIDIAIQSSTKDWIIIIEVKIDAVERPQQLDDYLSAAKGKGYRKVIPILLTKAEFEKKSDSKDKWIHVHYEDLAGALLQALNVAHEHGVEPHPIARYFTTGVLRDICGWGAGSDFNKLISEGNCFVFEKFTKDYFHE